MDKIWKPHKRQELFTSLPDSVFEALYGGAAGGGKTELLMMLPLLRGFHKEPRFKGIILRRTYPELEAEVINRSRDWYPHFGAKYNEEKKRWVFPSGAIIRFGHAEYEQDVRKYDTDEYNYMAFDELTSFTRFQYVYLTRSRCRSSSSNLPAIARAATNPGNVGHVWVREHFVEQRMPDGKLIPFGSIIVDKKTGLKRIFIQSFLTDNPHIMENDPQYRFRLESLPESERRAKVEGDWYTFEGQVFDDYREAPMEDEPQNACHICLPFKIPEWWLRFLSIDWGYEAMTCALWGALSPDDRLYVYREFTVKKMKTAEWSAEIGRLSAGESYRDIVMCRSAWQQRGDELTIQEKFKRFSGLSARQADNDRIAGKLQIQEYLRWKELPRKGARDSSEYNHETALKILRQQGTDAYDSYLKDFEETKADSALPRLQIFPDCLELRKCIPVCIYDKKSNVTNKPAEDVREFAGDDPYDTLRYLICSVDNYLGSQKAESSARDKENEIIQDFEKNKDWTSFYMRLAHLDRMNREPRPIMRFHR